MLSGALTTFRGPPGALRSFQDLRNSQDLSNAFRNLGSSRELSGEFTFRGQSIEKPSRSGSGSVYSEAQQIGSGSFH